MEWQAIKIVAGKPVCIKWSTWAIAEVEHGTFTDLVYGSGQDALKPSGFEDNTTFTIGNVPTLLWCHESQSKPAWAGMIFSLTVSSLDSDQAYLRCDKAAGTSGAD